MAKKIFIGATGQNCGKTTMSVSLMHLARKKYDRVGFMKPVGPKIEQYGDLILDKDAVLMAKLFGMEEDIHLMSPVALHKDFTRQFLDGKIDPAQLRENVCRAAAELEKKYDLIIIEGAGHGGVGSVIGLSNAHVARLLDAPVMMVTHSGIGNVIDAVHLNLSLYNQEDADVRLIIPNKLIGEKRDSILDYIRKGFATSGLKVTGGFNYSPILANPTLGHVASLLDLPLKGDQEERSRIIHHIQLGAASSQRVIDGLLESSLMIVTSSRDELIVTLSSLYHIDSYKEKIAGMVIGGHAPVSKISQQILEDSGIPYIRIHQTTADVFTALKEDVAKITAEDQEKIDWITSNADSSIDFEAIERIL